MCKTLCLPCSRSKYFPVLNKLRIVLVTVGLQLLFVYSLQAQYLLKEFKPKIKAASHTAKHFVQDDGKIVMLGDYTFVGDTPASNLLRFNSDGSLDQDFNLSSELQDQFTTDFRQCCSRANIIAGPEGDLVLMQAGDQPRVTIIDHSGAFKADIIVPAGYFQFEKLIKHKDGYIAIVHQSIPNESIFRLDRNGNIDPTFPKIDYGGYVEDMIVDPDNNIFIIGDVTISGTKRNLLKINEAGVIDPTFNNISLPVNFAEIGLFPDGKILVSSGTDIILLDANGNKIESFMPQTNGEQIFSAVIDTLHNRIIIVQEQYPLPVSVKALSLDGSVSDLFTPIDIGIGSTNALARILPFNNKFVLTIGDEITYQNSLYSMLVFDGVGNVDTEVSSKENLFSVGNVNAAAEIEGGDLIIGGTFSHIGNTMVNNLARIDKSGNVNAVFADNNPLSPSDVVAQIKISPDNQIYVGGFLHNILRPNKNSLIRLNADGELDSSFVTSLTSGASDTFLDDFIIMPDRIIACGYYEGKVVAFDFNGDVVPAFNTNIFGSQLVSVNSLCKIDEDNFAIGGYVLNENGFLWIMDLNGNIDDSFVRHDDIRISFADLSKSGNDLYISGNILGGYSSTDGNFIYRYNLETGVIDSTNFATYQMSENHNTLPLNDSLAVISGRFDHFNDEAVSNFSIANYNGATYPRLSFQVSPGIKGYYVEKAVALPDEQILLVGRFDKINNDPFYSVAILNYTNFEPQVAIDSAYSVSEDTTFYLSDLGDIIDLDDELHFTSEQNENFTLSENGLVTLKQNFNGPIELQFSVSDPLVEVGAFTTTIQIQPVNDAPVINGQLDIPHILPGDEYEIGFDIIDAVDVDGDSLTLIVEAGENYSLAGETSIQSDADFNGNLNVGVMVSDGSLTTDVFVLTIGSAIATGVETTEALAFYPNPFTDYLRIDGWQNIDQINIRTVAGQQLTTYSHADLQKNSGVVNTATLPGGMLLLSVALRTNAIQHIKLIKK